MSSSSFEDLNRRSSKSQLSSCRRLVPKDKSFRPFKLALGTTKSLLYNLRIIRSTSIVIASSFYPEKSSFLSLVKFERRSDVAVRRLLLVSSILNVTKDKTCRVKLGTLRTTSVYFSPRSGAYKPPKNGFKRAYVAGKRRERALLTASFCSQRLGDDTRSLINDVNPQWEWIVLGRETA